MLLIWIFIANICSVFCQYGVILSVENSDNIAYTGYLWVNSKIVFITPELKATVVKGISKSEKICGFELRSESIKNIPFIVYLLDELSGLAEMQIKPHTYLDNQSQTEFEMSVEAFDCDALPHYSRGATVKIHVLNESGPIFVNKSYTFSVRKDAPAKSSVGIVKARSVEGNAIQYSIQNNNSSPFQIDQFGRITISRSLKDIKQSNIQIRVLAKEMSKQILKQSLVFVTIDIEPVCKNRLTEIPDQLDYFITNGLSNMMESGQLIQQGHRPLLTICHLPSPLKEITLKISLKSQKSTSDSETAANKPLCQKDIAAARVQRGICRANPETVDLFLTEGGLISIKGDESIGPEEITGLENEFTLTWWMKIRSRLKTEIFCLQDNEKSVTISIQNCNLIINHPGELLRIDIPVELCNLKDWKFFALTQQTTPLPNLKVWVGGFVVANVTTKINLFQFNNVKLFAGRCSSATKKRRSLWNSYQLSTRVEMGVISMGIGKSMKVSESIECLSICGEAIVTADSITTLSKVSVNRKGPSIYLKSKDILQLLDSPTKIQYVNSFYTTRAESIKVFEPTDIWIDLSIECESKEVVTVPQAIIRINFIGPQKDFSNDTIDVEIVSNATITATRPHSIHIFPNLHFVNAITDKIISKDLKIESCTIRLLQRNLVVNEKIYLSDLWSPILNKHKLEIRSDIIFWSMEGEADGEVYENILRQVQVDMIDERKKFSILCTLKGGDSTSQAIVEVIQLKSSIHYAIEENGPEIHHRSMNERRYFHEKEKEEPQSLLNITKSKFIGVIIMAVMGGAAWALVTAAITCFVLRKRETMKNRKIINNLKKYSKNSETSLHHQAACVNTHDVFIEYEYEEDRTSMADIPDDEEQNLDNISCETCNMTDPEVIISMSKPIKEIPRSKTITFPIIHRKF